MEKTGEGRRENEYEGKNISGLIVRKKKIREKKNLKIFLTANKCYY